MPVDPTLIAPADPADLNDVLRLLREAGLPLLGVTEHFSGFLVARWEGRVIGSAGLEVYDDAALLRSVAVATDARGQGFGIALTEAALERARTLGVRMAYLMARNAAERFYGRLGFAVLPREAVDPRLAGASWEFRGGWPDGIELMVRPLAGGDALLLKDRVRLALSGRLREVVVNPELTPSAVLLLLYSKGGTPHVLFTRRTSVVEDHKGEVSFPGGAWHDGVDTSLLATALRESHEEVGVFPDNVEILGGLDDTTPRSRYIMTPYVGILREPQAFNPAPAEVAEVLEVPLSHLTDRARHRDSAIEPRVYAGRQINGEYIEWGDAVIWGATYRILRQFLDFLGRGQ